MSAPGIAVAAPACVERPLAHIFKDAAITAAITFALALPLVGFQTVDQTTMIVLRTRFPQLFYAVAVIFVGRLLMLLTNAGFARPIAAVTGIMSVLWLANNMTSAVAVPDPVLGWLTWCAVTVVALRAALVSRRAQVAAAAYVRSDFGEHVVVMVNRLGGWLSPFVAAFAVALPFLPFADQRVMDIGIAILTYVMLGWGLNVVVGLAGLLDLGYVAFYAVGAYTYALLSTKVGFNFWEALPLAGGMAASFGIMLGFPVLRLRGDYLAIVTLGFGEMIRLILLNWSDLSNGARGIGDIPRPSFFGMPFTPAPPEGVVSFNQYFGLDFAPIQRVIYLYYIILLLALVTNFFTLRIRKLPIGRAWEALREDEVACRALGINPTNTKLTAFAIGATFAGFAGSFFATRQGFISPESFNFLESAIILSIVVLGGMGSQIGVVVAAIVLIGGPEWFRDLSAYRMLAFGALMVAIMVWRPQGLLAHREPTVRLNDSKGAKPS
ncbi:MAG: high-affinity branched-chain amino acid ABC transporter permease LivM [Alphaproteobacteria bacterium]